MNNRIIGGVIHISLYRDMCREYGQEFVDKAIKEACLIIDDPFCPKHGRASRPITVEGLRCDCMTYENITRAYREGTK